MDLRICFKSGEKDQAVTFDEIREEGLEVQLRFN